MIINSNTVRVESPFVFLSEAGGEKEAQPESHQAFEVAKA